MKNIVMFSDIGSRRRVVPQDTISPPRSSQHNKSYFSRWRAKKNAPTTRSDASSRSGGTQPQDKTPKRQQVATPISIVALQNDQKKKDPRKTPSRIAQSLKNPQQIVHPIDFPTMILTSPLIDRKMVEKAGRVFNGVRHAYEVMITQIIQRLVSIANLPIFLQLALVKNQEIRDLVSTYLKEILCGDDIPSSPITIQTILTAIHNAPLSDSSSDSSASRISVHRKSATTAAPAQQGRLESPHSTASQRTA